MTLGDFYWQIFPLFFIALIHLQDAILEPFHAAFVYTELNLFVLSDCCFYYCIQMALCEQKF